MRRYSDNPCWNMFPLQPDSGRKCSRPLRVLPAYENPAVAEAVSLAWLALPQGWLAPSGERLDPHPPLAVARPSHVSSPLLQVFLPGGKGRGAAMEPGLPSVPLKRSIGVCGGEWYGSGSQRARCSPVFSRHSTQGTTPAVCDRILQSEHRNKDEAYGPEAV